MKDWEPYVTEPKRPAWLKAAAIGFSMIGAVIALLFYIFQP